MLLNIKVLMGGKEQPLEVEDDSISVLEVKRMLESSLNIAMATQSLVYKGKSLSDSQKLSDYSITDGTRLFLAIKPAVGIPSSGETSETITSQGSGPSRLARVERTAFWSKLQTFLLKHFSTQDTEKIVECFKEEVRRYIYSLNLETVECMAKECVRLTQLQTASKGQ